MKLIKPLSVIALTILSHTAFANDDEHEAGEKLYKVHCASCHGATGGMDMSKRIAPPIAGVRLHYISTYPDKDSFVLAVTDWLAEQDESKSLMRGAIQRFKIMPPISVPKEDAKKIAAYLFSGDIEKLEGFDEHVEQQHGKKGMGNMHGKGMHGKGMHGKAMKDKGMHGQAMGMHGKGMHKKGRHDQTQGKPGMKMPKMMQGMGMPGMMQGQAKRAAMRAEMMQQLNLSPEQKQKMQALIKEKEAIMQPLKKQKQMIMKKIQELDTSSPNYKSAIFSLADEQARLVHRMVIEKGEMRFKIESVLSPEQRQKFKQLRAKKREMKHGMGKGMGMPHMAQ